MAQTKTSTQKEGFVRGIDEVVKILSASGDRTDNEETSEVPDRVANVGRLKECAARMRKTNTFTKGQFVQWKEGLKNKATPAYGEPVIVIEVLKEPVFDLDQKGSGNPYFNEPLTLVAGVIAANGDFLCHHFDGRRFESHLRNENEED